LSRSGAIGFKCRAAKNGIVLVRLLIAGAQRLRVALKRAGVCADKGQALPRKAARLILSVREQSSGPPVAISTHPPENIMYKIAISFAVAASALVVTAATAAPLIADQSITPDTNIQNVRMVCNEEGRCWRERSERRVIIRDSYGYAPRERYIERRGYEERGGIGFRAPGVSVGIGNDRY
jgi:hypothetical protein